MTRACEALRYVAPADAAVAGSGREAAARIVRKLLRARASERADAAEAVAMLEALLFVLPCVHQGREGVAGARRRRRVVVVGGGGVQQSLTRACAPRL